MAEREGQIQWHQGFYGSVELELRAWQDSLVFEKEHELSKQPVRMDMLIVKKKRDIQIDIPFGRIFRQYNILEYKSPEDGLTIDDFFKVIGYAGLYKGLGKNVDEISAKELTVSLFRHRHPRRLFQALEDMGAAISRAEQGIYYVSGFFNIPVQVVATGELPASGHSSLRLLSSHLEWEEFRVFLEGAREMIRPGDLENVRAILEVSASANPELLEKVRRDEHMVNTLETIFKERFDAKYAEGHRAGVAEGTAANLQGLMQSMHLSLEDAMNLLMIPENERSRYRDLLSKQ